ncbi:MAG TPA: hypothetical protein VJ698_22650 [Noviherbaspirillum sp.]|uniref:hypothetical protein n=1 Tax=Noviherbaspirillum sp. TaxID=1926288 RepID=UPI002B4A12C5|nr:hypothetical protein [Noviherbaspirillum sp.]HJV88287.1 hypothetical protein [Noviherbaspirillum sp.]
MPFSDIERTNTAPKHAGESSFRFLDRSAHPPIDRVRTFLSEALSRYPVAERDELVARLRSENETHFRSATFEVFLHEALIRLGYRLSSHPDLGTGVPKRPDFLVTDADGSEFVLEAVLASERDGKSPAAEAMKETALGYLNETPHNAFVVDVESEGDPASQPSGKMLARDVHAWLGTLEPDPLRERLVSHGLDAMPTMTWTHEAWEVTLRAIPLAAERRGKIARLIGALGDGARWVNAWEPLRDAVKKKANRYGELTKPFVIAVNADIFHLDEIDEVQALYGEEYWAEVIGQPERSGLRRRPNGAWRGPHGPQNRRVSAVWFFNDLTPYTLANRRSTLYVNPWANISPPERLQRVPTRRVEGEELVQIPGIDLGSIYGLPAGWPE